MPQLPFPTRSSVALVAVGDPARDRTVYSTIVLLVALGLALILLAVWLLRTTRPDPDVLAPLERMGQRKWRRADPVWQRRHLDQVRPGGADPLEPSTAPPATDADFERGPQPIGFDDLVVSDATLVAATADLPAPSGAAVAAVEPLDVEHAGEPTPGEGTPAVVPDAIAGDDAKDGREDGGTLVDAAPDDGAEAHGDDDDEDITGEQDTDDFLAVLEREDEPTSDVEPDVAESDVEPDDGPTVEPDAEPDVEPDVASDVETDVESDIEPDAETDVESGAEAVVELDAPTASTANDDERV